MNNYTAPISIRVTPELKQQLEKLAEQNRRTLSDYVRIVLEDHVATPTPPPATGEQEQEAQ